MDFLCTGFPEKIYDSSAGGASHNGIIHHDHPFSFYRIFYCTQFDLYLIHSTGLARRDKSSSDIFVLDHSDAVRDARSLAIAQRSIQSGIRDSDDHVCFHRMLCCQNFSCLDPCRLDGTSIDDRVRSGKIDIFKHT